MKKARRMEAFLETLGVEPSASTSSSGGEVRELDPCYLGYFACFNTQRYYEAHDVLEHLWLKEGRSAPDYAFHKGLIQLAGGFVHLKLQRSSPGHPKHGRRLHPARRLFLLAAENLASYGQRHRGLELEEAVSLAQRMAEELSGGDFLLNPWHPQHPPRLRGPMEDEKSFHASCDMPLP